LLVRELEDGMNRKVGELEMVKDLQVQLTKNGKEHLVDSEEIFRLILTRHPGDGTEYWFLTKLFDIETEEALLYYKKRWDNEFFFRFLKQELNSTHINSTNPYGIAVMMHRTMITAMLVLVYKKLNKID
jgi:IS4 transposase